MSCFDELTLSIHADGELPAVQAARVDDHVAECADCRRQLVALRGEVAALRAALELPEPVAAAARPSAGFAAAGLGLLSALVVLRLAWMATGEALAAWPDWLDPTSVGGALNLLFNSLFVLLDPGGSAMSFSGSWMSTSLVLTALGLATAWGLRRRPRRVAAAFCLVAALLAATPAGAAETRKGTQVAVTASEVIDGSVVLMGETVRMEGTVEGDLVAFGRDVTVRGEVRGATYVFAQTVDLSGSGGGGLHAFGQWVRVGGSAAGSGYVMAQGVTLVPGSRIEGDAFLFGETIAAEGGIGRDLAAFGRRAEVRGEVGRHFEAWADEVEVAPGARVGGELTAHLPGEDRLTVADGSVVGEVSIEKTERPASRSRYSTPGFYLWRLVGLAGALVVGAALLWLAPWLLGGRSLGGVEVVVRLAVGLAVLVAVPFGLVILAVTFIGLPLAVLGLVAWAVGLYLAKIATADLVGRGLLGWPEGSPKRALAALAVGLSIVTVATALPWIGGWLGMITLLLGLGLLGHRVWVRLAERRQPAAGAG